MEPARKTTGGDAAVPGERQAEDLLRLRRDLEARGIRVRLPRPGATWLEREPIDFGVSVGDIVVRSRGREP